MKDNLQVAEVVTQYNGTKNKVLHQQAPASSNIYALIKAAVKKN